jgi:hypothetical protein
LILVGLICVLAPPTRFKVKKLPFNKLTEAVFDVIVKAVTLPLTDPVIIVLPVTINDPVI